ncbi:cache domain-containing protein, partial [Aeromonas veronii]|nr:cache domain-containing protein [Aeromonas veronii]
LTKIFDGKEISFQERQQLMGHVNRIMGNTDGIFSFQVFSGEQQRVIPLDEDLLKNRVEKKWIEKARLAKGGLVWIGDDPQDKNNFLAIRRISLIERRYVNGGYLLISINRDHFQFPTSNNQYSILLDENDEPIVQNYDGDISEILSTPKGTVKLEKGDYIVTKKTSNLTGWTVLILTPISELTKGLAGIRTGIILSGVAGGIIFMIFSLFLSTVITRPIVHLTKTMQRAGQ